MSRATLRQLRDVQSDQNDPERGEIVDELVKALKNEVHDLGDVIEKLICHISDQDQQIGRLEGTVEALQGEVALWREGTQIEKLQAELEQQCHQFAIYNEQRLSALAENERLQADLAAQTQYVEQFKQQLIEAEAAGLRMGVMFYCQECDDFAACKDCYLDGIKDTTAGQPILDRLQAMGALLKRIASEHCGKECNPEEQGYPCCHFCLPLLAKNGLAELDKGGEE
jgi:hypothetical protein